MRKIIWPMVIAAALYWTGVVLIFFPNFLSLLDYSTIANRQYLIFESSRFNVELLNFVKNFPSEFISWAFSTSLFHILALVIACLIALFSSHKARIAMVIYMVMAAIVAIVTSNFFQYLSGDSLLAKMDLFHTKWVMVFCATLFVAVAISELRWASNRSKIGFLLTATVLSIAIVFAHLGFVPSGPDSLIRLVYPASQIGLLLAAFVVLSSEAIQPKTWPRGLRMPPRMLCGLGAIALLCVILVKGQELRLEWVYYDTELGTDPALEAIRLQRRSVPFRVAVAEWHPARVQLAGIETFGGASPVFNGRYRDLAIRAVAPQYPDPEVRQRVGSWWHHILMSIWHRHSHWYPVMLANLNSGSWNFNVLAAANVRYLLTARPIDGLTRARGIPDGPEDGSQFYVYDVPDYMPRVYMAGTRRIAATSEALLDELSTADDAIRISTVWMTAEDSPSQDSVDRIASPPAGDCGDVLAFEKRADEVAVKIDAHAPCDLVLLENHDPYWSATVDGLRVPLSRANHAFMTLRLAEPGKHEVRFVYDDPRFPGLLLFIPLGALVLVLAPLSHRRRGRPHWPRTPGRAADDAV